MGPIRFQARGKGFHRLAWKPDFSSLESVKNSKLPEFKKGKNYIIVMADVSPLKGPIDQIQFSHIFTNFNDKQDWWISKIGTAGTILHKSPRLLEGTNEQGGYGYIVAIWESK